MKIAIIGVGAMGSIYAGMLSEAGHEVWAIDPWAAHVAAINAEGLRLSGASGDRVINTLQASVDISQVGRCDICVIATKASGVAAAAQAIAPIIGPDCLVLTHSKWLGCRSAPCPAYADAQRIARGCRWLWGIDERPRTRPSQRDEAYPYR